MGSPDLNSYWRVSIASEGRRVREEWKTDAKPCAVWSIEGARKLSRDPPSEWCRICKAGSQ
jgi:hypothetical protein